MEAALKSAWLVIHSPLVAHVVLKMLAAGKIQYEDPFKNAINRSLCYFRSFCYTVKIYCCDFTDDCPKNCT